LPAEIDDTPKDNQWIIEGMMPIAVAHAEAAARAADVSLGEWLSRLIADNTVAQALSQASESSSSQPSNDTVVPSRDDSPRLR
jgi:hypothetical protein